MTVSSGPQDAAAGGAGGGRRTSGGPSTLVNGAVALIAVLLVVTFALRAASASPPGIAEFAPQANKPISQAPTEQTSVFGSGQNGAAVATPTPTPTPTPTSGAGAQAAPTLPPGATIRPCVGNPPRQIEDPQSPPCVPYWPGKDNGGGTAPGVTHDAITVVLTNGASNNTTQITNDLVHFFNERFEFYGRKIVLQPPVSFTDCNSARPAARQLKAKADPFAVVGSVNTSGHDCYVDELARNGVISVSRGGDSGTSSWLASLAPYAWQYAMPVDTLLSQWGAWACAGLAGHPASYSTDPTISSAKRVFGLINETSSAQGAYSITSQPLRDALASCGESLKAEARVDISSTQQETNDSRSAIQQMKAAHVSTILCLCLNFNSQYVSGAASGEGYFPEWSMYDLFGLNLQVKGWWPNSDQRQSLFGVFSYPAQLPYASEPVNWALADVQPGFQVTDELDLEQAEEVYWTLLVLSSGIQMAGPDLTPANFEHALQTTTFPNPPSPLAQGRVGFQGGAHNMIRDFITARWSDAAPDAHPDQPNGAWCYSHRAQRYGPGTPWPSDPDLKQAPCYSWPPGS
jgi:Periplasmic binding protein